MTSGRGFLMGPLLLLVATRAVFEEAGRRHGAASGCLMTIDYDACSSAVCCSYSPYACSIRSRMRS